MTVRLSVLAFAAAMALAGCAKKNSQSYRYSLNENGCDTGEHSYSSQTAMCEALESDAVNNSCALNLRAELFRNNGCSGNFSPVP